MIDSILIDNPYEKIYRYANPSMQSANREEAQTLIKHLGLMYNTFGLAIKDFVKLVSSKFQADQEENPPLQRKIIEHKNNSQSQYSNNNMPTQDKQLFMSQNMGNIQTQKIRSTKHPIAKRSSLAKNTDNQLYDKMGEHSSQHSQFSVTYHPQKGAITRAADISSNLFQLHPQMVLDQSPKKEEHLGNDMNFEMFQLSHKQRLKDPSFVVIEEDEEPNSTGKKYENPFVRIEPIKLPEEREQTNFNWENELEEQEDSMMRVAGGRKKKDREKLKGISCMECEKYYKIMQMEGKDICDCTSRHRSNRPAKKFKNKFTQDFDLK